MTLTDFVSLAEILHSLTVKQVRLRITPFVEKYYHACSGIKFGYQDKTLAPHSCSKT